MSGSQHHWLLHEMHNRRWYEEGLESAMEAEWRWTIYFANEAIIMMAQEALPPKVNLFYAEKRSVIPGPPADERFLTKEMPVLRSVERYEAENFIRLHSHYRSTWRIEDVEA